MKEDSNMQIKKIRLFCIFQQVQKRIEIIIPTLRYLHEACNVDAYVNEIKERLLHFEEHL